MAEQLTAQQRAQLFAMSTRQNFQMLAKETAASTPATLTFTLPKARLLSNIMVRVKGKLKLTHASVTNFSDKVDKFTFYKSIRRVSLDLNNGFAPFVLSGEECAMYNMIDIHPSVTDNNGSADAYMHYMTAVSASSSGYENDFAFTISLPTTLNGRDPIGLILLQNDQTNVTLSVDLGTGSEMLSSDGLTAELKDVTVIPMLETFSIPANAQAYPDLSVLKLTNGRKDSMPSVGQQIVKLTTGTIYRKIIFKLTDAEGKPMAVEDITSPFEIVFNQADVNYSISAEMLKVVNHKQLGYLLPKGMYVFDFSNAGGFTNLGGTRDYIDSANLTEFWLRFTTSKVGKIEIVTECLSRLA